MVLTFSGLDGSGKSTQITMLAAWLRDKRVDCRIVETHRLTLYSILGSLIRVCWPSGGCSLVQEHYDLYCNGRRRRFIGCLRSIFFWADILTFSVWVKLFLDRRGKIVLCDRSLVDEAIQLAYLGFCSEGALIRRLRVCPAATCAFYLSVSPEIAYARSPEYPVEHFLRKDHLYRLSREVIPLTTLPPGDAIEVQKNIVEMVRGAIEGQRNDHRFRKLRKAI